VEARVEINLKSVKQQISDFVAKRSNLGVLINPKKEASISKVIQQLGFVPSFGSIKLNTTNMFHFQASEANKF